LDGVCHTHTHTHAHTHTHTHLLDGVRHVRYHLYCLAQIIALALPFNDLRMVSECYRDGCQNSVRVVLG
jgi:hypothetical protein